MAFDKALLREYMFPTIFCPGCGHGVVQQAFLRAVQSEGWDRDDVVAVSGIGCSARIPAYPDVNGIQTTHGRALAFAAGIKMTLPEKHVVLFLGDGDCSAIGGNHLIHACRRNMDMTVIVVNNYIYGMTGGQASPTTPTGDFSSTTQFGNIDNELDICKLAEAAGATFVARTTAFHAQGLEGYIRKAFANHGFSLLEVMCPCPTGYGRRNGFKGVASMYDHLKDAAVPAEKFEKLSEEEKKGRFAVGVLYNAPAPEYLDKYHDMVSKVRGSGSLKEIRAKEPAGTEEVERFEIRMAGSGGQGLIMGGMILAEAMIRQNKLAVQTQSYGVEARGGSSKSEVVIGDREINFPEVISPDLFVALMPEAYEKYAAETKKGGIIITDSTYIEKREIPDVTAYEFPISEYCADELGDIRAANIFTLGIISGLVEFMDYEALESAVLSRLAPKLHALNRKALACGNEIGRKLKAQEAQI